MALLASRCACTLSIHSVVVSLSAILCGLPSGAAVAAPLRAADFASSIGVNVHVEYTDGGYASIERVRAALKYMGVNLVRDAAPNPANQGQGSYGVLARGGIRLDLFVNGEPIGPAVQRIADLERLVPGSVAAIEGPNEINNHSRFSFGGESDRHRAATLYQAGLYIGVKRSSDLVRIPVYAFTDYPNTPGPSDVGNFHSYPKRSEAIARRLNQDKDAAAATVLRQPIVCTEVGFPTVSSGGVTDQEQARLILEVLLDEAVLGAKETYIYQLLDAYPDPSGLEAEKHYGLFDIQYRPKAAAVMLRKLTTLFQDAVPDAKTFPVRPFKFEARGLPSNAQSAVFEKADGTVLIALWRPSTVDGPPMQPSRVQVTLQESFALIRLHDIVGGLAADGKGGSKATFMLSDSPIFLEVSLRS